MGNSRGEPFDDTRTLVLGLALLLLSSVDAAPSHAEGRPGSGTWLLGLELQQRTFDTMSAGDTRPLVRGDAGVRVSIDHLLTPRWALGLSGHFGGTWLDWSDPLYNTAGNIEDAAWDVRLGVDRVFPLGMGGMVFAGVGIEYGEARSWIHTLGPPPGSGAGGQNIDDEGPHCYRTGGYVRASAMTPAWRRMALCAQVWESFYGAHASDPPFATRYNWFGRSVAASVGLRFEIARGRTSEP
jgi:hypothetical protein